MKRLKLKTIGFDLDDTLCKECCWTVEDVKKSTPNPTLVKRIKQLYDDNFIIIYTARRDRLMSATFEWLRDHGVRFHAVSNQKIPLAYLVDKTVVTNV